MGAPYPNGVGMGVEVFGGVSNDGESTLILGRPYVAKVVVEGTCPLLFHRWSDDAVEAKGAAPKGSKARKTDDIETYVYRCPDNTIGIPGTYLKGSICNKENGAAKYRQDPRSPRKSALDLYKAGVHVLTDLASLGKETWDFLDRRRVKVQQSAVTRMRPGFWAGWAATFEVQVLTPEYIPHTELLSVLNDAGRLVGLADFRPTYGRFQVTSFSIQVD